jgi:beta-glucanase (GH16 family)
MERDRRSPFWVILAAFVLVVVLVVGPVADVSGKKRDKQPTQAAGSGWQLVFEDDFNGQQLDEQKWTSAFPWGRDRSNVGELQYYAPDAFRLGDGKLNIVAKPTPNGSHAYDSGLISSHASFAPEYGRFEIRCKLPSGKGLWPAFWLLPEDTSWPPEIDVFEALGQEPRKVHMTAHWLQNGVHEQDGGEYSGPDFSRDYHTFAVEWTSNKLAWFVDGAKRHEVSGQSPRGPMYLLANLAVGGDWPGAPDASTQFPAMFDIDYIRAYTSAPAPVAKAGKAENKHKNGRKKKHHRKRHRMAPGDGEAETFQ